MSNNPAIEIIDQQIQEHSTAIEQLKAARQLLGGGKSLSSKQTRTPIHRYRGITLREKVIGYYNSRRAGALISVEEVYRKANAMTPVTHYPKTSVNSTMCRLEIDGFLERIQSGVYAKVEGASQTELNLNDEEVLTAQYVND